MSVCVCDCDLGNEEESAWVLMEVTGLGGEGWGVSGCKWK